MKTDQGSPKQKLLIIGNGMATGRLLDELQRREANQYTITVLGDEPQGSYNRIMLSAVLAGQLSASSIIQKPSSWYDQHGIAFKAGIRALAINRASKTVACSNGEILAYDQLVIATGSRPAAIKAANQQLNGVMVFRKLDDVDAIVAFSKVTQHAVVVGGGLLGLEAAYGMAVQGMKVTLIHRSGWLLNRQLDKSAGILLAKVMATKGVDFHLNAEVVCFNGGPSVTSVTLSTGQTLPCDIAIIATGITPNAELGFDAGLAGNRGIDVDDRLATSDPGISAIGECIEHQGETFGLVEPIWQHCRVLADRLAASLITHFRNKPVATKLKVSGVQVFSAGEWLTQEHHHEFIFTDSARNIYRKILLQDQRIVGIVLLGDVRNGHHFFELMERQVAVAHAMPQLLMGRTLDEFELQMIERNDCVAA